jgi:hypothetical protein
MGVRLLPTSPFEKENSLSIVCVAFLSTILFFSFLHYYFIFCVLNLLPHLRKEIKEREHQNTVLEFHAHRERTPRVERKSYLTL